MATMLFTEISIRALKGSDQYETFFDSKTPGFGVRVGKRSKTFVIVRGRNRERISIGRYPNISLADARTEAKRLLAEPSAPKTTRKTFEAARDEYLEGKSEGAHRYHLKLIFSRHFPSLNDKQLGDIEDSDIRVALDAIAGPSARLHAFRAIRAFFRWVCRPPRRYLKNSPLEGYEAPGADRKGTRILTDDELKTLWGASETTTQRVFRLMALWGTRNGETVAIQRTWIKDGVITIPGAFTKNGRDHAIPILPMAQSILESLPQIDDNPFFFTGSKGHLTSHSLAKVMRGLQANNKLSGFTTRDIRRTFRSNMARLGVSREVGEVLINHAPPVLDEIYDRYDRLAEKREALAKYEAFMLKLTGRG